MPESGKSYGKKYHPKHGNSGGKREHGNPGKTADGHMAHGAQKPLAHVDLKRKG